MDVFKIYIFLLKEYGRQGWWPVFVPLRGTTTGKPMSVIPAKAGIQSLRIENGLTYGIPYKDLKKHKTAWRDPYFEIAVGAILTQSAAWKNVALAINNLYEVKTLTPSKIASMPSVKLQKLIKPAGYFRQKAKKLKLFSNWLIKNYGGDIRRLNRYKILNTRYLLLQLWGIGPETADSIILYALNKPIFVVDEYTRRLCKKFGVKFKTYDEYQEYFQKGLIKNCHPRFRGDPVSGDCLDSRFHGNDNRMAVLFREYHALIVASGKEKHTCLFRI